MASCVVPTTVPSTIATALFHRTAVFEELAIRVKKVDIRDRNPTRAIVDYLAEDPCDLMVLGTEGRSGLPGWMRRSVAESAAEESETMTLFVPNGSSRGFAGGAPFREVEVFAGRGVVRRRRR